MERHGWLAVGRGLTLRPRHHLNVLAWLDKMDPQLADLWVKFCYGAMYARGIVDDKTRLLCMIGDCLAVGEETQARGHMRGALRQGASPREVMEVCFMTCINFGMPPMLHALEVFVEVHGGRQAARRDRQSASQGGKLRQVGDRVKPIRTALFAPGNKERVLAKASESDADAVIFDLEDSVPIAAKAGSARARRQGDRPRPCGARRPAPHRACEFERERAAQDRIWVPW